MAWSMIPAAMGSVSNIAGAVADANKQRDAEDDRAIGANGLAGIPGLSLPDANYSFLDYSGDYNPYSYAAPKMANASTIGEDPQTRATEMAALQQLVSQGGAVGQAKADAARYGALSDANQLAQGREGAIRTRMANAGQSAAGMDAILQAQSAQSAANRARSGTLDAVQMAALEKLANQQAILGAAGNVRGQDLNVASQNADIINRFNLFNTQAENEIAQKNTAQQNAAALRNLNTRQDISGRNTGIANSNVDRATANAKAVYNANIDKATAVANARNGQASQASNSGNVYNQLGQQGSQLFTNIGSGIAAEQARQPQQTTISVSPQQQEEDPGHPYDQMIVNGGDQ